MHLLHALAAALGVGLASASLLPQPQTIFVNPPAADVSRIPTVHESAVMARRILHLTGLGTLSTIFPASPTAQEDRPSDVGGTAIGLVDYIADCEHATGNPTILALDIATSFKNVAAGSNLSLSINWALPKGQVRSPASLPRFSLQGYLEDVSAEDLVEHAIPACFAKYHPDAQAWYPGNRIHSSRWARLVVKEVYWIGGFGDRAYIGWIPVEEWRNVTRKEVRDCVLPGEDRMSGWRAWLDFGDN
ncbi:pyridoxamine 5'-phosphate oxidase-domain-containing protein [Mycena rosella]|uniref:Pyridoxamine 5'-phosphate oxidase-domain-containing protein n=1 Tax=Mycena rosella TaxID=1033263 RepID=A0AAD7D838_MYCRO|nr:pyridoxamine 5'-phosphate oxidase-domain-containing protein [Mycena rosella]